MNKTGIDMNEEKNTKKDEYLSELSQKKGARILSIICLIVIVALVIATFIAGITGSRYFTGFLVLSMLVPFMMYVFLWIGRVLNMHKK